MVGLPLEVGRHVQLPVEEAVKPEAEAAVTLIQPMVVVLVVDHQVKLNPAILTTVLVRLLFLSRPKLLGIIDRCFVAKM